MAIIVALSLLFPKQDSMPVPEDDSADTSYSDIHKLIISELMSNNGGVFVSETNEICDYLELYNGTEKEIRLNGYALSDRKDTIKWTFPDVTIPSHGYLVVSLSGKLGGEMNAPFALSSKGGESVILLNPSGKIIDACETVALTKNESMVRENSGAWGVSSYGTPGYPNNADGLRSYLNSLETAEEAELVINEILIRNNGNFKNEYGYYDGFVEFKNVSDHTVHLGEYVFSDSESTPFLINLPDRDLYSGEVISFYIGNRVMEGYLGRNLSSRNGTIILSRNGKIVDRHVYENLSGGMAEIRNHDGSYSVSSLISMGEENTPDGIAAFQKKYLTMPTGLVVNELMSQNDSYLEQNGNRTYDWIELYNNSSESIQLSEYSLNQNTDSQMRYTLNDVSLPPYGYYVVMCSGNTLLSNQSYQHVGFKLSEVDNVYLYHNDEIADSVAYADLPYGYSYGRGESEGFFYFDTPTPLYGNGTGVRSMQSPVEYSANPGVYDDVEEVVVELFANGTIHYTTDGSIPDETDPIYESPLHLKETSVIKAKSYAAGSLSSEMMCASYIINEHHTLPVMSVSLNPSYFNDLNWNPNVIGLQREAYAELYEDGSSFSIPCSMACFGGNTRSHRKKSYALRFNDEWGEKYLEYPLFDKEDNSIYESVVLRTGSNDWDVAYMRDILASELLNGNSNVDVQDYKIVVLYINGQYWGLYNIREKINTAFFSEKYNIPKDDMNILRIDYDVTSGSYAPYNRIREYANTHSMANDEYYEELTKMIDIDNFIDYWISESFISNNDIVNCRFWNSPYFNDGKFRWILYDTDLGWYNIRVDYYWGYMLNAEGIGQLSSFENDILRSIFNSPRFRERWLERMSYMVQNIWNADNVIARINEIHDTILPEMYRNQERWGLTMEEWEENVQYLRDFAIKRTDYFLNTTKNYFGLSESRMKELFPGIW